MDKHNVLNDLLFKGHVVKEEVLYKDENGKKVTATFRNLLSKEQEKIENQLKNITGSVNYVLHTYQSSILDYTLMEIGNKKFNSPKEVKDWKSNVATGLVDRLIELQTNLEKEISRLIRDMKEDEAKDFSTPPESDKG